MNEMTCLDCGKTSQPIEDENVVGVHCGHCGRKYSALELRMAELEKTVVLVTEVDEEGL
jgi:DNA-directed RNA polymerase subunit RPC12/RpoP